MYKLASNGERAGHREIVGSWRNVIESSTITIRLITSWQNLSFVQSCDLVGGILLLALRNLDKHLIIISNND